MRRRPRQFTEGWQLGKPDLVLSTSDDFVLGPGGRDLFRVYVLPTDLTEDKFVVGLRGQARQPARRASHAELHRRHRPGPQMEKLEREGAARTRQEDSDKKTATRRTPIRPRPGLLGRHGRRLLAAGRAGRLGARAVGLSSFPRATASVCPKAPTSSCRSTTTATAASSTIGCRSGCTSPRSPRGSSPTRTA